jgi:hypothetical protein
MDSAFSAAIPDSSLAAIGQLSENSRLGFASRNPALHRGIEWSKSTLALGLPEWSAKTASDHVVAANNGNQPLLTPNQQKALHCLGQTVKAKGLSIGLDVAGSIPGFGNLFSGAAAGIQGLNAAYYGTVSLANAGNTLLNPSASGAANTAATAGFAVASLTLSGSKAIPVVGTIVSLGFLAYDIAGPGGAISTYQQCMAGPG